MFVGARPEKRHRHEDDRGRHIDAKKPAELRADEHLGTPPEAGWFFLSGERRHCFEQDGVAYVVNEQTIGESTGIRDTAENTAEIFQGDILTNGGGTKFLVRHSYGAGGFTCI
jgi:hypothetical protein